MPVTTKIPGSPAPTSGEVVPIHPCSAEVLADLSEGMRGGFLVSHYVFRVIPFDEFFVRVGRRNLLVWGALLTTMDREGYCGDYFDVVVDRCAQLFGETLTYKQVVGSIRGLARLGVICDTRVLPAYDGRPTVLARNAFRVYHKGRKVGGAWLVAAMLRRGRINRAWRSKPRTRIAGGQ